MARNGKGDAGRERELTVVCRERTADAKAAVNQMMLKSGSRNLGRRGRDLKRGGERKARQVGQEEQGREKGLTTS